MVLSYSPLPLLGRRRRLRRVVGELLVARGTYRDQLLTLAVRAGIAREARRRRRDRFHRGLRSRLRLRREPVLRIEAGAEVAG